MSERDDERNEINERLRDELEELRSEVARLKRGEFTPEEFQMLCHHRNETPGCTRAAFEHGCIAYQVKLFGPPREFTDIVFENPPSAEAHARFVEVENAQGQSIEFGEWLQRADGMWVLRIPYMAEDVDLDKLFKAKPTKVAWHYADGKRKGQLRRSWALKSGAEIWQGHLLEGFVYRAVRANGDIQQFKLLRDAKEWGAG